MSQKKYSLLYPDTNAQYRTLSDVTMHDLGMDLICKKLSAKEREQNYIQNVMARLYADPVVTQYRCDIFEDVLQQKKMRDDLMEILERISFLRDYGSFNREYDESACIWDLCIGWTSLMIISSVWMRFIHVWQLRTFIPQAFWV